MNWDTARIKVVLLVISSALVVTLTFFGGYVLGANSEKTIAEGRVSDLSNGLIECEKNLAQWCSSGRLRVGMCDGKLNMCMCVKDSEVKSFEF